MASKNTKMIHEVFGRRPVASFDPDSSWPLAQELIGIEIEVEDLRRGSSLVSPYWSTHSDGSLRNGVEYVLVAPTGGRQLTEAINHFFDAGLSYTISPRTSIHIHLNASDNMTIDQFRNMFVIMYLIEPAVFRWSDENRKWCGYCSPLTDLTPERIINILNDDPHNETRFITAVRGEGNSDRYYGFNVAAYNRHGTVEFRYFPCTSDRNKLVEWVKFCMCVKKTARNYGSPEDVLALLTSGQAITSFINEWFGDIALNITRNLDYEDCLSRISDMRTMVNVSPTLLRNPENAYRVTRSRGFNRYVQKNFPNAAVDAPNPGNPATASEVLFELGASVRVSAAEAARRYEAARQEYDRACLSYSERPTEQRRVIRQRAFDALQAAATGALTRRTNNDPSTF